MMSHVTGGHSIINHTQESEAASLIVINMLLILLFIEIPVLPVRPDWYDLCSTACCRSSFSG